MVHSIRLFQPENILDLTAPIQRSEIKTKNISKYKHTQTLLYSLLNILSDNNNNNIKPQVNNCFTNLEHQLFIFKIYITVLICKAEIRIVKINICPIAFELMRIPTAFLLKFKENVYFNLRKCRHDKPLHDDGLKRN